MDARETTPFGYCQCGCGRPTSIIRNSNAASGDIAGQPHRFIWGHSRRRPLRYVVEDRGHKTPCWIWQGKKGRLGYAIIDRDNRRLGVHRYFYEEARGAIPDGLHLDHLCRVPSCVNPDHLEPVTSAENSRRGARAKLDWPRVLSIRIMAASTSLKGVEVAEMFSVSPATISEIVNNRIWQPEKSWPDLNAGWAP